jgi:uncharacterized DUF497 family protein
VVGDPLPEFSSEFDSFPKPIFEWDAHNISHIARHDVKPEEAERVILNDPLDFGFDPDANGEERWTYLRETDQARILMVVITLRGAKIRVVTSFEAEKRDKLAYLKMKGE